MVRRWACLLLLGCGADTTAPATTPSTTTGPGGAQTDDTDPTQPTTSTQPSGFDPFAERVLDTRAALEDGQVTVTTTAFVQPTNLGITVIGYRMDDCWILGGEVPAAADIGPITYTTAGEALTSSYTEGTGYPPVGFDTAGDTMDVSAEGGIVFGGSLVDAAPTVTRPLEASVIVAGYPLAAEWQPVGADFVWLYVTVPGSSDPIGDIHCIATDDGGFALPWESVPIGSDAAILHVTAVWQTYIETPLGRAAFQSEADAAIPLVITY
jgi:hypothetical protein